jgi:2-polyprenyl-3-methyl-5-hydroxy-6-metoxy-1,4-benzoquinol methylase
MNYDNTTLKKLLEDIIDTIYGKNPVILKNIWDATGERNYINSLRSQYENILIDFNSFFESKFDNKRVLEISSFLGVMDIALARMGFEVHTFDIPEFQNNRTLNKLYEENNVHPSSGYLHDVWKNSLPYPDNHFDAVIFSEVIEHLNFNPLPLLQEMNRILKQDGILYITTPNQVHLMNRLKIIMGHSIRNSITDSVIQVDNTRQTICGIHWREYTLSELTELLEVTGFTKIHHKYSFMGQKSTSPLLKKFFYAVCSLVYPQAADSITIIAKKKEFRPIKFWFPGEYIKYIKSNYS